MTARASWAFSGTILYERLIRWEGGEKFADLTSWITLPEYRNYSLRLFEAVASLQDRTLTCHTAIQPIHALYQRFGFRQVENEWIVIPPTLNPLRLPGWFRGRITTDVERILEKLDGREAAYVRELESDVCHPMLVTHRGQYCLIIFTRAKGRRIHFSRIHHVSNREVFSACLDHICWRLALANRTLLVAVDAAPAPRDAFRGAVARPRWRAFPCIAQKRCDRSKSTTFIPN